MSNIPISSLPVVTSLDGTEYVPLVQGGTTKRATIADISTFPASGSSFVMATASPSLTGSRLLASETNVTTVTDAGALSTITVGVATNGIGNTKIRQGAARSVIGVTGNALANVADIVGTAGQVLRVNTAGTALAFGSIDIGQSTTVGTSILLPPNGGTGVNNGASTFTLGGNLSTVGAFASTFTFTGATGVTFPTSGTLATTAGPSLPAVVQGDLLYGSAANVLSTLAKNATATRYLSNTGATNNPAWAQVDLTNGVTGILPVGGGGSGIANPVLHDILIGNGSSAMTQLAPSATSGIPLVSQGSSADPAYTTAAAVGGGTGISTYATGDTIYASAANALSKLTGNITTTKQYLSQTGSGAASAAPAWATIAGADITGAALTAVNDTNVTLTLGGTPATSLLRAASVTAGWSGQLSVARGGTNLASGTSGGILGFTGTTTLASSVLLTANALVLGGGSGATPVPMASLGTTTTVLHGNAAGAPTFGAVAISTDVSGLGTGVATALAVATNTAGGFVTFGTLTVATQRFTATGTYTPTSGMLHAFIECIGGGGGGAGVVNNATGQNSGGGGGAGGYSSALVTAASVGASKAVTIGAAGTAGSATTPWTGGAGGDTSVGALCIAKGGSGGIAGGGVAGAGGAGGVAGTGDTTGTGQPGGAGVSTAVTTLSIPSSFGGSTRLGGGAPQNAGNATTNGAAGTGFGTGGGGAISFNNGGSATGGAGTAGYVIITEYINL